MLPRLLALIAPPLCGICGETCAPRSPACHACTTAIATSPAQPFSIPSADRGLAATSYDGVARQLITALKFNHRLALAAVAAEAIATKAGPLHGTIVPVPPDPWRARLRGFDPATLIAENLAHRLSLPVSYGLVRRHAPRQVGQPRSQRLASRHDVRTLGEPPPTTILLDDVATTGATLTECASALRAAGTADLLALAFARA